MCREISHPPEVIRAVPDSGGAPAASPSPVRFDTWIALPHDLVQRAEEFAAALGISLEELLERWIDLHVPAKSCRHEEGEPAGKRLRTGRRHPVWGYPPSDGPATMSRCALAPCRSKMP